MCILNSMLLIMLIILICVLIYTVYQLRRNEKVYAIRQKWVSNNDDRWDKYSYHFMCDPNKYNLWGFKFPKDEHFKK